MKKVSVAHWVFVWQTLLLHCNRTHEKNLLLLYGFKRFFRLIYSTNALANRFGAFSEFPRGRSVTRHSRATAVADERPAKRQPEKLHLDELLESVLFYLWHFRGLSFQQPCRALLRLIRNIFQPTPLCRLWIFCL